MHEIVKYWNIKDFRECKVDGVTSCQKIIRYLYYNTLFTKKQGDCTHQDEQDFSYLKKQNSLSKNK